MAKLVQTKNRLKEKVGDGGFKAEDLERAQTAIDENNVDFAPIAEKYLSHINQALTKYHDDKTSKALYAELLDALTQLRAQGSMFHYPSITSLTNVIVDLFDSIEGIDATMIEIVEAYEKSARMLLSSSIQEEAHSICKALVSELSTVCQKYKERK